MVGVRAFLDDEAGAVTLDWVALSAGIVLLAVVIITAIGDTVDFRIDHISSQLSTAGTQSISL